MSATTALVVLLFGFSTDPNQSPIPYPVMDHADKVTCTTFAKELAQNYVAQYPDNKFVIRCEHRGSGYLEINNFRKSLSILNIREC